MKKTLSLTLAVILMFTMIPMAQVFAADSISNLAVTNGDFELTGTTTDGAAVTGWEYYYYMASTNLTIPSGSETLGTNIEAKIATGHTAVPSGWDGKAMQMKGANNYSVFAFSNYIAIPEANLGLNKEYTMNFKNALSVSVNARGKAAILYYKHNAETGVYELYNNGIYTDPSTLQGTSRWQTRDAFGDSSFMEIIPAATTDLGKWGAYSFSSAAPTDADYIRVAVGVHGTAAQRDFYDSITLSYSNDNTPPAEVSNLTAQGINGGAVLNWTNPTDSDFSKTLITVNGETHEVASTDNEYTVTGLTNGSEYTVDVKTIDVNMNKSAGVTVNVTPVAPAVNSAPSAVNPIGSKSIWADEIFKMNISNVFSDINLDPFTVTTDKGTLSDNILTYTPSENDSVVTITLTADDGMDVGTDVITLTVNAVPNETPQNVGDKYYLNVVNPGFERTNVDETTGVSETNVDIIGWNLGYNPTTATQTSKLYYNVKKNIGDHTSNALFSFDQENTSGQIHATDLIPAAPQNLYQQVAYNLDYLYKTRFVGIDGTTITGNQYGAAMTFYNAEGQIWTASGWSAATTSQSPLATQFTNGKVITGDNTTYSHKWYTGITSDAWTAKTDFRTAPAGTAYVRAYLAGSTNGAWIFAFDDVKVSYTKTYATVNVSSLTKGEVSTVGGTVTDGGTVELGGKYSVTVTPASGYIIDYIKYDGVKVVNSQSGVYNYTTPSLNGNKEIIINFIPDYSAVKVDSSAVVYNSLDEDTNNPTGITFATAKNAYGSYSLVEYGMVFSKTDVDPEIGKADCEKAIGTVARNANGQYGIKFIGKGIKSGNTYYTKAYAIYSNGVDSITVYGSSVSFTPQS